MAGFGLKAACAIGIIGGADGPTSIYLAGKMAPQYLGAIAVASYSYMSLVPLIQPPIIKMFTSKEDRSIVMTTPRAVSQTEKVLLPLVVAIFVGLVLPAAVPLIGMMMFGNFIRESKVVDRLSVSAQNEICNITTIFLGLTVGATMKAEDFLKAETLKIVALGLIAFMAGTAMGVIFGQIMKVLSGGKINLLLALPVCRLYQWLQEQLISLVRKRIQELPAYARYGSECGRGYRYGCCRLCFVVPLWIDT